MDGPGLEGMRCHLKKCGSDPVRAVGRISHGLPIGSRGGAGDVDGIPKIARMEW